MFQFSSIQDDIRRSGKPIYVCPLPVNQKFPQSWVETVAMLVWLMMALSRPLKEGLWALPHFTFFTSYSFSSIFLLWEKFGGGGLSRFSAPRKLPSKRRDRKEHIFLLETRLIGSFGLLENNFTSKYPSRIFAESNQWLHFTVHTFTDKVTKAMFSQSWNFYNNMNWW